MKNSELLKHTTHESRQLLTAIERQTLYCLRIALTPASCPMCHQMVNQVEASGKALDDFPAGDSSFNSFACPHCKTELVELVPFMGPIYQWHRKHPVPIPPEPGA